MRSVPCLAALGASTWLCAAGLVLAQPRTVVMVPVPAPASAVAHRIQAVADLERAVAFYRDVIGLAVIEAPAGAGSRLPEGLAETPGARARAAVLELPGAATGLLLAEFEGVNRRPQRPRRTDPGAATLVVSVRDVDAVLSAAREFGSPVAVGGNGTTPAVLVDPDGFFVEVDGPVSSPVATGGNVVAVRVGFTVDDPERVVAFYRDILGFAAERGTTPDGRVTRVARIPGGAIAWEFAAAPDGDRMAHRGRLQDPGTATMAVRVPNARVAAEAARRAGLPVLSAGGEPVQVEAGSLVLVRDPGGLLLELIEGR